MTTLLRRRLLAVLAAVLLPLSIAVPAAAVGRPAPHAAPAVAGVRADDGAHVVGEQWVAPRQLDLTISSPALHGTGKVRLLTPDGWRAGRHVRRWPVFWLLHGCCGDYTSWTAMTDVAKIPALRHVLVVMPEAGVAGWYSDWWNHGAGGAPKWETFHLSEMRQILDRGYGTGPRRVIAGLSMGGLGALSYTARHPGMFRAAASYSGVVHPLYEPGGPANVLSINQGQNVDPYAVWGDPTAQRAIWAAHDPYELAAQLRHTPMFLSVGDGTSGPFDPPGESNAFERLFNAENHALAARLRVLHAPVITDFYGPGTHTWPYWQRELHRSLPLLLAALAEPDRPAAGPAPAAAHPAYLRSAVTAL